MSLLRQNGDKNGAKMETKWRHKWRQTSTTPGKIEKNTRMTWMKGRPKWRQNGDKYGD